MAMVNCLAIPRRDDVTWIKHLEIKSSNKLGCLVIMWSKILCKQDLYRLLDLAFLDTDPETRRHTKMMITIQHDQFRHMYGFLDTVEPAPPLLNDY